MPVRAVDDKPSDTLVVVSGEGFWTGSSTLPHLHHEVPVRDEVSLPVKDGQVGQGLDESSRGHSSDEWSPRRWRMVGLSSGGRPHGRSHRRERRRRYER